MGYQRLVAINTVNYVLHEDQTLLRVTHDRFYGAAFELPLFLLTERVLGLEDPRHVYLTRHVLTHLLVSNRRVLLLSAGVAPVRRPAGRRCWSCCCSCCPRVFTPIPSSTARMRCSPAPSSWPCSLRAALLTRTRWGPIGGAGRRRGFSSTCASWAWFCLPSCWFFGPGPGFRAEVGGRRGGGF